ncbi:MAG: serine/threonine protein kinase [Deltaproteobacteria bacterium]|nr:serine/threonine protein kinase [Deltaproteobacteria bacterium]
MNDGLLSQGERVDRYVVEGVLGEGGMAVVYRLRHQTLGSAHALKVLKIDRADIRARLVTEGQLQASLRHPNIVAVNDVLDVRGRAGLLMELVEGPSLYEWLYHNNPPLSLGVEIFRGILAGVARAHRAGLVHRDLKAANVLLDSSDGKIVPKVTDFGLAKVLDEGGNHTQTRTGMALGTPRYMAPEQIRNSKDVDARADVFALGCLLYRFACGRDPFESEDTFALFESICHGKYPAPEALNPAIPASVRAAIVGSLAVDREQRIPDCETLLAVLDGEVKHKLRVAPTMAPASRTAAPPPPATAVSAAPWLALGAVGVAAAGGAWCDDGCRPGGHPFRLRVTGIPRQHAGTEGSSRDRPRGR